ncbi:hypothetical protein HKCCE2091_07900 [Rhodobacterales bacterium HKCCE2091]|nr:hypothetical protein [Rhodobacterales bacterium HKCCE2091]
MLGRLIVGSVVGYSVFFVALILGYSLFEAALALSLSGAAGTVGCSLIATRNCRPGDCSDHHEPVETAPERSGDDRVRLVAAPTEPMVSIRVSA